ncbi:MAG: hypothetical protein KKF41_12475 [Actinobacteria bacterium]|nr:hypothetical protein [Actinomycetota bacterium]MBU1944217.1 hypothetical protein [Actinomycetota bacterium]MBU2688390.1 hypothetical protein [Actinomycetota bacterium]
MEGKANGSKPYSGWQKAVLAGCLIVAVLGTIMMVGGMVKLAGTISEFGGSVGAPLVLSFVMGLLSLWLFAGAGALLVYIAKKSAEIADLVRVGQTA